MEIFNSKMFKDYRFKACPDSSFILHPRESIRRSILLQHLIVDVRILIQQMYHLFLLLLAQMPC